MRQSLTSQMIDGVFPSKVVNLDLRKNPVPLKTCVECFMVLPVAVHQCHTCGRMTPTWYKRQEKLGYNAKAALKVSE